MKLVKTGTGVFWLSCSAQSFKCPGGARMGFSSSIRAWDYKDQKRAYRPKYTKIRRICSRCFEVFNVSIDIVDGKAHARG